MNIRFKKFLIVTVAVVIAGLINYPIYLYFRNLSLGGDMGVSFEVISNIGQVFSIVLIFVVYKLLKRIFIK